MGVNAKQCQSGSALRTGAYSETVYVPNTDAVYIVAEIANPFVALAVGDMLTVANSIVPGVSVYVVAGDNTVVTALVINVRIRGLDHLGRDAGEDVEVDASGATAAHTGLAWSRIDSVEVLGVVGDTDVLDTFSIGFNAQAAMNLGVPAAVTSASYTIFDAADGTVEATTATDDTNRTCRVASTTAGDIFVFRFDPGNPAL